MRSGPEPGELRPPPDTHGSGPDVPARVSRWYLRLVRRHLGVGPYLDFGCGTGTLLRRLAAHGSASGFEVSGTAAATARSAAPGCPVYTSMGDVPSGVFRGLIAVHALDALDDDTVAAALACWRRVLVPGGRALVVIPDPVGKAGGTAGSRTPEVDWRRVLVGSGFTVRHESGDVWWNGPHVRVPLARILPRRLLIGAGWGKSSVFVAETRSFF
jgi:SAM-dependent methyltransferase